MQLFKAPYVAFKILYLVAGKFSTEHPQNFYFIQSVVVINSRSDVDCPENIVSIRDELCRGFKDFLNFLVCIFAVIATGSI